MVSLDMVAVERGFQRNEGRRMKGNVKIESDVEGLMGCDIRYQQTPK